MLARVLAASLIVGIVAVAPVSASTTRTSSTGAVTQTAASAAKVVIIVGPVEGGTSTWRSYGDSVYAEAIKFTPNVTRVYSPDATWDAVKAAIQGANIVVYMGHGNGWPSPYGYDPTYAHYDGMGLNDATHSDYSHVYYGEPSIANEVTLAPNAIVLLNHLCYASGNNEPQYTVEPTLDVARQRIDNYGAGFIKAGAKAVIAYGHASVGDVIDALFTTDQTIQHLWETQPSFHGNESSFASTRSPGFTASMDPDQPTAGFYRSIVTVPALRTTDVINGTPAVAVPPASLTRIAGPDRYATAAAISAASYAPGVPVAYIATGLNFPDALAGAPIAGTQGGPLLLTDTAALPAATATELARLKPGRIVVLGGPSVVSDAVMSGLAVYAP